MTRLIDAILALFETLRNWRFRRRETKRRRMLRRLRNLLSERDGKERDR